MLKDERYDAKMYLWTSPMVADDANDTTGASIPEGTWEVVPVRYFIELLDVLQVPVFVTMAGFDVKDDNLDAVVVWAHDEYPNMRPPHSWPPAEGA